MAPLLIIVNATGLQGISVICSASEAGFNVRAQVRSATKPEAIELSKLPNVTLVEGSLEDESFVNTTLFKDADYAWVNTTYYLKDEVATGKALALAAQNAGVKHYLYSALGDHSKITNGKWKNPIWVAKYNVEEYIRTLDKLPSTFVYVGCYLQNYNKDSPFTSLKRQEDGSLVLAGKFTENAKIPNIDVERDLGPAIVKILKDGPEKWNHKRVPLAYELNTMPELAKIFSDVTGTEIKFVQDSSEFDPNVMLDCAVSIVNEGVYFDFESKVPQEARELNPNWHSTEDFAKNKWVKP